MAADVVSILSVPGRSYFRTELRDDPQSDFGGDSGWPDPDVILQLSAEGQTTKAIASILKISGKTVEYHRAELMGRLNILGIQAWWVSPCGRDC